MERFGQRILPLETQTLVRWGLLTARLENSGLPMALMDSLMAAAALQHNLIIVTRHTSDFHPGGVQMINPWE